jgi:hypothetical protein
MRSWFVFIVLSPANYMTGGSVRLFGGPDKRNNASEGCSLECRLIEGMAERVNVVAALQFHRAGHNCVPPEAASLRRPVAQNSVRTLNKFHNFSVVQSIPMIRGLDLADRQPTLPPCCSATMV